MVQLEPGSLSAAARHRQRAAATRGPSATALVPEVPEEIEVATRRGPPGCAPRPRGAAPAAAPAHQGGRRCDRAHVARRPPPAPRPRRARPGKAWPARLLKPRRAAPRARSVTAAGGSWGSVCGARGPPALSGEARPRRLSYRDGTGSAGGGGDTWQAPRRRFPALPAVT